MSGSPLPSRCACALTRPGVTQAASRSHSPLAARISAMLAVVDDDIDVPLRRLERAVVENSGSNDHRRVYSKPAMRPPRLSGA